MKKQKLRSEIEDKYKWDLSYIFKNEKEIDKAFKECEELTNEIQKYKDIILDENSLYELISLNLKISSILDNLILYASLKNSEDSTDNSNQSIYLKINNFIDIIYTKISFVQNTIYKLDYNDVEKFIEKNDKLKEYKFLLEVIFKEKEHKLSDEEEQLLSNLSSSLSLAGETYETLCYSDMTFGSIKNENGEEIELTDSNYGLFAKSNDRSIRKNAFERYYGTYGKYKNTLSTLYTSHVKTVSTLNKLRKYKSTLQEDMSSDNLSEELYTNLINTVNDNLGVLHKYYDSRKKILNIDENHIYDMGAPVSKDSNKEYSFESAKSIILDTFKIMGNDYVDILNKAFNERWIDVYNNKGKSNGAFSAAVYGSKPYVLTNFENRFEDVSAVAHELGHSVHSYISMNTNPYQYFDYSHFLAEVASLTNEIILHKKMYENEENIEMKKYILNHLIKLYVSNFFDAVLYAEFEKKVHDKIEKDEILTTDDLCNLCYDLNKKYYGDNVVVDDLVRYRWEIYSHLYSDFYLYKYATGISCATYCANNILNNEEGFLDKYKKYLSLGSSCYSNEALLTLGIDVTKKDFIENTIKFFNNLLEEFIKLND